MVWQRTDDSGCNRLKLANELLIGFRILIHADRSDSGLPAHHRASLPAINLPAVRPWRIWWSGLADLSELRGHESAGRREGCHQPDQVGSATLNDESQQVGSLRFIEVTDRAAAEAFAAADPFRKTGLFASTQALALLNGLFERSLLRGARAN